MNDEHEDFHARDTNPRILKVIPCPPGLRYRYEEYGEPMTGVVVCLALVELTNGVRLVTPIGESGYPVVTDADDGLVTMELAG